MCVDINVKVLDRKICKGNRFIEAPGAGRGGAGDGGRTWKIQKAGRLETTNECIGFNCIDDR